MRDRQPDVLKKRVPSLDVLRFFAVVMVITYHTVPYPISAPRNPFFFLARFGQNGGFTGVDLFFVLSGYLIGGLLFDEQRRRGNIRIGRFLTRRAFKIYPPFWAFLIATIAIRLATGAKIPRRNLLGELFFLQNYLGGLRGHTWSLAVEEHFYLTLPLLLLILIRIRRGSSDPFRVIPLLTVFVVATCLLFRALTYMFLPAPVTHMGLTHLRIDSLLIGVSLAYFQHYHADRLTRFAREHRSLLLVFGALGFLPAFGYFQWWLASLGSLLFAVAAAALITATTVYERIPGPVERTAAFFGARSYSIYLWHMTISDAAEHVYRLHGAAGTALGWVAYASLFVGGSLLFGSMMATLIEVPALRLRDSLIPRSADPLRGGDVSV